MGGFRILFDTFAFFPCELPYGNHIFGLHMKHAKAFFPSFENIGSKSNIFHFISQSAICENEMGIKFGVV